MTLECDGARRLKWLSEQKESMVLQTQVKEDEEMIRDILSEMIDTINLPVVPSHPRLPTVTSFPYFQSTDIRIKQGQGNKETVPRRPTRSLWP